MDIKHYPQLNTERKDVVPQLNLKKIINPTNQMNPTNQINTNVVNEKIIAKTERVQPNTVVLPTSSSKYL